LFKFKQKEFWIFLKTILEKRAKFDNGEDPLDAEEQAQQGHHGFNPFGHGFNPFGGGGGGGGGGNGFNFKFKFN
jgi:DnaJ family protein C protein 3